MLLNVFLILLALAPGLALPLRDLHGSPKVKRDTLDLVTRLHNANTAVQRALILAALHIIDAGKQAAGMVMGVIEVTLLVDVDPGLGNQLL